MGESMLSTHDLSTLAHFVNAFAPRSKTWIPRPHPMPFCAHAPSPVRFCRPCMLTIYERHRDRQRRRRGLP